ncbi:hypothetical protein PYJP_00700 [Pyrofollis japonicus]|uniref:ferritin-like domain-containing protein n=1 Tax=Pyrofollis japonicus TaxID=3060460 RepID=UPI00295BD6F8|nr:ferritin-like domain-containing protein [Pyrofollis japonicus]BEP16718.1 hypothetical protein PYJP_00700 [Pyrofollis japonicus]
MAEDLVRIFTQASENEKKYAEELENIARDLPHPILRALLLGIAGDSRKHSLFYQAAAEIASGKQGLLTREELAKLKEAVRKHIETERNMVELAHKLLHQTDDPRLKLVLEAILEDENRHHALLVALATQVEKLETIEDEQEFWKQVWSSSTRPSKHYLAGPRTRE